MYRWEKSLRELEEKSRKNPKNPSFSSTLLDEIYRSIDGNDEKTAEELRFYRERNVNNNDDNKYVTSNYCRSGNNGGSGAGVLLRTKVEKEEEKEVASLKTRASLIEKWMDKKVISADKVCSRRSRRLCSSSVPEMDNSYIMKSSSSLLTQDNDPLFFSSSSISSDSSSGGLSSSSSDTEFFSSSSCSSSTSTSLMSNKTSRKSCFTTAGAAPWPKPVRTSISRQQQQEAGYEYNTVDDHQNNRQKTKDQETLIKSKNRAMKIYANLKNVKQPISPGARLTSFINSLFTHGNTKKSNNTNSEKGRGGGGGGGYENPHSERKSKSTQASSTSYSSFSRSCLSKTPPLPPSQPQPQPRVEEKLSDLSSSGSTKRTVRFYPVSVIVGEDCRPCGHKCIYDAAETIKREQKSNQIQNSSKNSNEGSTTFPVKRIISHPEEEEDYDDCGSDSSSDLFEIDHLSLFNNDRFREELPVYETTNLDRNLAIARGLIR